MKLVLVIGAVICGVVFGFHIDTGDLKPELVAGAGIVMASLAHVAP